MNMNKIGIDKFNGGAVAIPLLYSPNMQLASLPFKSSFLHVSCIGRTGVRDGGDRAWFACFMLLTTKIYFKESEMGESLIDGAFFFLFLFIFSLPPSIYNICYFNYLYEY